MSIAIEDTKAGAGAVTANDTLRNIQTLHPTGVKQMSYYDQAGTPGYVGWSDFKRVVEELGPYKDELIKIAEAVGEADDPFAAWESISLLTARAEAAEAELASVKALPPLHERIVPAQGDDVARLREALEPFARSWRLGTKPKREDFKRASAALATPTTEER